MVERATKEENKLRNNKQSPFVTEVKRERYYDKERDLYGIYTEKVCNIRTLLPAFIKVFVPESSSILVEKAWNSFPDRCLTIYESPFLGNNLHLSIESKYIGNDKGDYNNALNLSDDDLSTRQVVHLNIASEEHLKFTSGTNVRELNSKKKESIPVMDEDGVWIREGDPIMCCYKVAKLHVNKKLGLPAAKIEQWGHKHGLQLSFLRFHRKQLCWIDSWSHLNVSDVDGMNDGVCHSNTSKSLKDKITDTGKIIRDNVDCALSTNGITSSEYQHHVNNIFAFSDESNPFLLGV